MRKLLATLATLTLVFSSASIAGQTTFSSAVQDSKASKQIEQSLNAPQIKNRIAQQLNVNANELGNIKLKTIDVAESANGQHMTKIQIQAVQDQTFFCWLTGGAVANFILNNNILPNTNVPYFSQQWLNAINCNA